MSASIPQIVGKQVRDLDLNLGVRGSQPPVNGGNNNKCFEFSGYWNSTTHSLDYEC